MTGPLVIKIGGAAICDDDANADSFWSAVAKQCVNDQTGVAIVHGGGPIVDARLRDRGCATSYIDGLRVTPSDQISEVVASLAGVASTIVAQRLQRAGARVLGMRSTDAATVRVEPIADAALAGKLGCVATAAPGQAQAIDALCSAGVTPVVSSIGVDDAGDVFNINADDVASALAATIRARELLVLTSTPGVLDAAGATIPLLDAESLERSVASGVIAKGMAPKARAAVRCAKLAFCAVRIASWRHFAALCEEEHESIPCTRIVANTTSNPVTITETAQ